MKVLRIVNQDNALYRTDQIRAMDRYAIETLRIPGFTLMQRAGRAAFKCIRSRWPSVQTIGIVCGAGNNAGDGYVVAHLARQEGLTVLLCSLVTPEQLHGDARLAYQLYLSSGGQITDYESLVETKAELLVDALLGTGLTRPVSATFARAINWINGYAAPVVALDTPSGLNADNGQPHETAVKADLTVTFIAHKRGLFTAEAAVYTGDIELCDLGVPDEVQRSQQACGRLLRQQDIQIVPRVRTAHKRHCGHVLIIGGDSGFSGAVLLAAEAAARTGAGLTSVATRREHAGFLNLGRPEIMCHGVNSAHELENLLTRSSVIAIGPGLGQSEWAQILLACACASHLPLVVDADALNGLNTLSKPYNKHWILTPHPGEAARLLESDTNTIQQDRYAAVTAIQARYGGTCILKGSGSLIATDNALIDVNTSGNPGMASGGMGDVLCGVIAALLAQGLETADAARMGVHIHGAAADIAAQVAGERGLLARDLMPHLRKQVNA